MIYTYKPEFLDSEGAGSIIQREIYAYFLSKNDKAEFVRTPIQLNIRHEPRDKRLHYASYMWENMFSFLGPFEDQYIWNKGQDVAKRNPKGISIRYAKEIIDRISQNRFDTLCRELSADFNKHNVKLLRESHSKFSYDSSIALHLRNYSIGDTQLGEKSLPWEIFSEDYGLANQNNIFYAHFYASLCKEIAIHNNLNNPKVNIYSTGNLDSFSYIKWLLNKMGMEVKITINEPSYIDFIDLVSHKYIIGAKSSFSYLVALCTTNKMYIRDKFRMRMPSSITRILDDQILSKGVIYWN